MTRTRSLAGLAVSFAVTAAAAAAGSAASIGAAGFYQELERPSWAPPSGVFGPVWTVLYIGMAVAAWLIWRERHPRGKAALAAYLIQLALNALWSWLFFAWRNGAGAFVEGVLLWAAVLLTTLLFARIRKPAALLMVPYLLWVTFASFLTFSIWRLNPGLLAEGGEGGGGEPRAERRTSGWPEGQVAGAAGGTDAAA